MLCLWFFTPDSISLPVPMCESQGTPVSLTGAFAKASVVVTGQQPTPGVYLARQSPELPESPNQVLGCFPGAALLPPTKGPAQSWACERISVGPPAPPVLAAAVCVLYVCVCSGGALRPNCLVLWTPLSSGLGWGRCCSTLILTRQPAGPVLGPWWGREGGYALRF